MSIYVTAWAWKQGVGNMPAKLVLLKLADQANDEGVCWPSRRTISHDTELSISTVKRAIQYLVERGDITVQQRRQSTGKQSSNIYYFCHFSEGVHSDPRGVQPDPGGVHSDPGRGSPVDHIEPSVEPVNEPQVRFPTLDEEAELKAENARLLAALRKDLRL